MTSVRLYGKKTRCFWCAKEIVGEPKRVEWEQRGKRYDILVCSPECEQAALGSFRYIQKFAPLFLIGIVGGAAMATIPKVTQWGLLLLGITIMAFPFTTPQTTQALGMKRSFLVGRVLGALVCLLAIGLAVFRFVK